MEVKQIGIFNNSLTTFRIIAAVNVFWGHACVHLDYTAPSIQNKIIFYFQGVPIFFALSGFLIWQSINRSINYKSYLMKRFWRIYPELWVAVIVEITILLLLYDHHIVFFPFVLFTIGQFSIFQFWTPDCLRDYGCGCPNGSLWTITVLIQFYFFVWFLHKFLHKKGIVRWIVCIILSLIIIFLSPYISYLNVPKNLIKLYNVSLIPYLWMFLISCFLSEYLDKTIYILKKYWYIFLCISIIFYIYHIEIQVGYSYGILKTTSLLLAVLGFSYAFPTINIKTDISYGLYIYHMTIINAFIELNLTQKPLYVLISLIISILLAYISTVTIGNQSKKIKEQFIKK